MVIIISYATMDFEEAKKFKPTVIFPDTATNKPCITNPFTALKSIVKSRLFNFAVFFSLAIVLLYYAFRSVDFTHIAQGFREVNYFWIAISLLIALIAHALRAIRWGYLMESLGHKPPFSNLFAAVMFGYLANLALPALARWQNVVA